MTYNDNIGSPEAFVVKPSSSMNKSLNFQLKERIKELDCIYSISGLAIKPDDPLDEILQNIVDRMPLGFQCPESTCVRITIYKKVAKTTNFRRCRSRLETDITINDMAAGKLEVGYLGTRTHKGSPFTGEERKLIQAITACIGMIIENKTLRDTLEISEKQYRNLIDNALVGIYQTNLRGDVLYVNDMCLHILGYKNLEEARQEGSMSRYRNPEDRKTLMSILKQTGKITNFEAEFLKKTGESVVVLLSASLESDTITGMMMDISEYKKAGEALRKSESLHRLLAENVSDVIWTMDLNLNFTYISPSIEQFRGTTVKEALQQPLREVLTPRSYEIVQQALKEGFARDGMAQQEPFETQILELEHIRSDGSKGWAEVKVSFLRDEAGKPTGILGVTRDITHRKEAENELRIKSRSLEEVNTALKVLLEQREKDKIELENKILFNVKKLVLPYVHALKQRRMDEEQRAYVSVLETNVHNIISPFAKKLISIYENFTPQEIKVADFIRDGKTVKEIAVTLGVSASAINLHRQHIRDKLGLKNQKINLRTYLLSLTQ